ncbi:MAG: hypothetical protein R2706_15980 [Acidimicrobiales bacterium]
MIEQLEQLLADDLLDELGTQPITDLRALRVQCSEAEGDVSLVRRVAQGRLDIIGHDVRRRAGATDGEADVSTLLFEMPDIMADEPRSGSAVPGSRPIDVSGPGVVAHLLTIELDKAASPSQLAEVRLLDDTQIREVFERLRGHEVELSILRRRLHERIDAIQSEIARRYRDGEASVDTLLS